LPPTFGYQNLKLFVDLLYAPSLWRPVPVYTPAR